MVTGALTRPTGVAGNETARGSKSSGRTRSVENGTWTVVAAPWASLRNRTPFRGVTPWPIGVKMVETVHRWPGGTGPAVQPDTANSAACGPLTAA